MAKKYLDDTGLSHLWSKLKDYFQVKLVSGTNIKTINNTSLLGSGNISISGGSSPSDMADYVVSQGTSGIWKYRKWNSGIAECWGIGTCNVTTWTMWGSMYYGAGYTSYNYPSGLFNAIPVLVASGGTTTGIASGDIFGAGFSGASSATGTKDKTPQIFLTRPSSGGTGSYKIFMHAFGTWK